MSVRVGNECKSCKDMRDNLKVRGSRRSTLNPFFVVRSVNLLLGLLDRTTRYSTEIAQLIHPLDTHLGTLT